MRQAVIMAVGFPASGKSSGAKDATEDDGVHLSRDKEGGKVIDLVPKMEAALKSGQNVFLDCTFLTVDSRKPFIDRCKELGADIYCFWYSTSVEDCQINALHRMYERYGEIFFDQKSIRAHHLAKNDPNIFPIAVLFKMKKQFEKPTVSEGFSNVTKIDFKRKPIKGYGNKALFLDYDGTLRECVGGNGKYPVKPSEVKARSGAAKVLKKYMDDGYILLGVSNQSGIGKGIVSEEDVIACFEETNSQLGIDIPYSFSPHKVPPVSSYCRKPQSGMGVKYINEYKLDPSKCIMVGDMTSDKTFAKRLGMKFVHADEFFKEIPEESYSVVATEDGVSVNGLNMSVEQARSMIDEIWEALASHNRHEILRDIDISKVGKCQFMCRLDDDWSPYGKDSPKIRWEFSFQFDRGVGDPADAYYDSNLEEKEYIDAITEECKLPESMENCYEFTGNNSKDLNDVIVKLKSYGLKQVDPWW